MKKIARIFASLLTVATLTLLPTVVHAQTIESIEVDGSALPTTGAETPATPDTGFAPSDNKVLKNSLVFITGSALGAGLGYGYLAARKKRLN